MGPQPEPKPAMVAGSPLEADRSGPGPFRSRTLWAWMAASCLLLGASGSIRTWREDRLGQFEAEVTQCPFPLESLPRELGYWRAAEGDDQPLDELTLRIAGGADYIVRTYTHDLTGVNLHVLVIYGAASRVAPHTPEVCYPSFGYKVTEPRADRTLGPPEDPARFGSSVFEKGSVGIERREEVFSSLLIAGRWAPDPPEQRRTAGTIRGAFKIQVQRRLGDRERRDQDNPTVAFLELLLPEIGSALDRAEASTSPPDRPRDPRVGDGTDLGPIAKRSRGPGARAR